MSRLLSVAAIVGVLGLFGCDKPPAKSTEHAGNSNDDVVKPAAATGDAASRPAGDAHEQRAGGASDSQGHDHVAPHGGKLVELDGDHVFVEICLNANLGEIAIYVGDCTNPIRISQPTLEIHAAVPGFANAKSVFDMSIPARENPLTGEKTGDSAEFRGRHEQLRELASLDGVIAEITVRGKKYENVKFSTDILADK